MTGGIHGQYLCIKEFSEVDYTEDLKKIDVPVLFLQLAGLVASIVFMVDVRPALRQVSGGGRGGRRGGGSSSDGPYGPYNGGR